MNFTDLSFFLFFPIILLGYYLLPKKFRWMHLLLFSYIFYAFHNVQLLFLIMITTGVSYLCGLAMEHFPDSRKKRKILLTATIVCLGILFFFKYLNFTLSSVATLLSYFHIHWNFKELSILLPVGISFYTFQTLSYVIDVYQGKIPAEKHFGYYALYVVFFPQLVAGPIERPAFLLPQLKKISFATSGELSTGLLLLLRGYAKKMVLADYLASFVDTAYGQPATAGGMALFTATILFAIQIYCDFSGYTDIARGLASFFGVQLSENFRSPYQAVSIRDFWKRWHISLTKWFTDYVYIPLGGNQKGRLLHYRNILLTFLISGLWHGADFTYIIWGGLHGIFLILENIFTKTMNKIYLFPQILRQAFTFLLVCLAWIFFRADNLNHALLILKEIFTHPHISGFYAGLGANNLQILIILLLLLFFHFLEKLPVCRHSEEFLNQTHSAGRLLLLYFSLLLTIFICHCLLLNEHGAATFLYFQF